ncbi:LysR family transcriptional regulator [Corallococcus sp. EGB]|uniref:LysR family transcriptional regulator n=1 Tax=Corallococcus sp. EGB TaxID=1521117 RepID=UPI001CBEBE49|nr:LysR substrate-binding domain-containing protein [Corallococcus sp. EGB]
MARLEINRSGEMEVFVRVVEQEGFSAAARTLRMPPSAVSKLVARLGARFIHRNTRGFQLTSEGCVFYERSVQVLAELEAAERGVTSHDAPSGRVRVNSNVPYGTHVLLPQVVAFQARYPGIRLDIGLTDHMVDLLEDRADVAIRAGALKSSNLIARRLGETRKIIVGAPAYLKRMGTPKLVAVLEDRNPGDTVVFHSVFLEPAKHLPARIRAFLDYFGDVGMG